MGGDRHKFIFLVLEGCVIKMEKPIKTQPHTGRLLCPECQESTIRIVNTKFQEGTDAILYEIFCHSCSERASMVSSQDTSPAIQYYQLRLKQRDGGIILSWWIE